MTLFGNARYCNNSELGTKIKSWNHDFFHQVDPHKIQCKELIIICNFLFEEPKSPGTFPKYWKFNANSSSLNEKLEFGLFAQNNGFCFMQHFKQQFLQVVIFSHETTPKELGKMLALNILQLLNQRPRDANSLMKVCIFTVQKRTSTWLYGLTLRILCNKKITVASANQVVALVIRSMFKV